MFDFNKESGEIFIYDDIGPSWLGMIDASSVIAALAQMGDQRVTVRMNTPGGSVTEAFGIYNALKRHRGGVDTAADSLVASAGSYIFQAGENRIIAKNAMLMIHDPWGISIGDAAEHRATADLFDKFADSLAIAYADSSGKTVEEARAIMVAETWYDAQEAIDAGFASAIGDEVTGDPVVASGRFQNAPKQLLKPAASGSRTVHPAERNRLYMKQMERRYLTKDRTAL